MVQVSHLPRFFRAAQGDEGGPRDPEAVLHGVDGEGDLPAADRQVPATHPGGPRAVGRRRGGLRSVTELNSLHVVFKDGSYNYRVAFEWGFNHVTVAFRQRG